MSNPSDFYYNGIPPNPRYYYNKQLKRGDLVVLYPFQSGYTISDIMYVRSTPRYGEQCRVVTLTDNKRSSYPSSWFFKIGHSDYDEPIKRTRYNRGASTKRKRRYR
jgi:hypothetical protein